MQQKQKKEIKSKKDEPDFTPGPEGEESRESREIEGKKKNKVKIRGGSATNLKWTCLHC